MNELELQRTVTRIALKASGSSGFALAGSGAIREHGVISRAIPRDFFDVDAIRASGYYTDVQLIEAATERDPGFEVGMFATQLERVNRLTVDDLKEYGVGGAELNAIRKRLNTWAAKLIS